MTQQQPGTTRRELRLAATEQAAAERTAARLPWHRRPWVAQHAGELRTLALRPEVVALVCAAFLAGGVTQGQIEQSARQEHRDAVAAAEQREQEHLRRVDTAAAARLTAQATLFAASKRSEALAIARTAVETAGTVVQTAAPVVSPETLSPLDAAASRLAALVASAPDPVDVLPAEPVATPLMTGPRHDGEPSAPPVPAAGTSSRPAMPSPETVTTTTVEAAAALTDAPATTSTLDRPTSTARTDTGRAPLPAAVIRQATTTVLSPPVAPSVVGPVEPLAALDLRTSAEMVEVAQEVITLSAQVQATAQANVAAAQAAAQAAAEAAARAEAERAAAASVARRAALTAQAPNGAIPRELLCGVPFQREVLLRCDAAAALERLDVAFRAEFGRHLDVVSSYRDYATQVATKQARGALAGAPGTSNHGRGLAVDLDGFGSVGQFDRATYRWMRQHASEFGWHHPTYMEPGGAGPQEPWHWEFGTTD